MLIHNRNVAMTTEEGFIMMYVILGSPHDLGLAM